MLYNLLALLELRALEKRFKQLQENLTYRPHLVVENVATFGSPVTKFGVKITDKTSRSSLNNWSGNSFYFPSFSTQKYTHHMARFYADTTRDHFLVALGYTHDLNGKSILDYEYCRSNISAVLKGEPTRLPREVVDRLEELIKRVEDILQSGLEHKLHT